MSRPRLRACVVTRLAATVVAVFAVPAVWAAGAAGATASAAQASGNLAPAIEVEPKALAILKGACEKLAAAKTLSVRAVVSDESPSRLGPPLVYFMTSQVTLQRPDKLRVLTLGDGPRHDLYYDGKTVTVYSPTQNFVATAAAPGTIDAMLADLSVKSATYFPFEDLIAKDPYQGVADGLRVAFYVGESDAVGGVKTHIIVYANDHAFVQAWIGVDDRLPRRLRAVFRKDPLMLRHEMDLSDWKLGAPVAAEAFVPPASAKKALPIAFSNPYALPARNQAPPPAGPARQ